MAFVGTANAVWFSAFSLSATFAATLLLLGIATEAVCGSDPPG